MCAALGASNVVLTCLVAAQQFAMIPSLLLYARGQVIAHDQAAAITRAAQTVEQAANNLLAHARSVYDARGADKFGDDTTVMVVDLNPSALNVGSADGVCGCCAQ